MVKNLENKPANNSPGMVDERPIIDDAEVKPRGVRSAILDLTGDQNIKEFVIRRKSELVPSSRKKNNKNGFSISAI